MDIETILDAAEAEAPGLQELAQRYLEAEPAYLGVALDMASVMARRAEGVPGVHVAGAADELVRHLAAQPDALGDDNPLMALARAGAEAMVSRTEIEGAEPQAAFTRKRARVRSPLTPAQRQMRA